jgi:hypothetical protein
MDDVERWWNGRWGRLARRDIWLRTDGSTWEIKAAIGGADEDRSAVLEYSTEEDARAELATLLSERGTWTRL